MFVIYLLVFGLVLTVPILLLNWGYRWLARKGYRKLGLIIVLVCTGYFFYSIYTAVYPTDSFYAEDFTTETGMTLPASADILGKDANYPDIHGHYTSVALVKLSAADYQRLRSDISKNSSFRSMSELHYGNSAERTGATITPGDVDTVFARKKMLVAFLKDRRHVLLERCLGEVYEPETFGK